MVKVFFSFLFLLFLLNPCCFCEVSLRLHNETEAKFSDGTFEKGSSFFRGVFTGGWLTGMLGGSLDLFKMQENPFPGITGDFPGVWGISAGFPFLSLVGGAVSSSGILSLANEPAPEFFSPFYQAYSVKYTRLLSLNKYSEGTSNLQAGVLSSFVFSPWKIRVQAGGGWRQKGKGVWTGGEFFASFPGGKKIKGGLIIAIRKKGLENDISKSRLYPQFPSSPYPFAFSYLAWENSSFSFRLSGSREFYLEDKDSGFIRLDYKFAPVKYLDFQGSLFYSLPGTRNLDGDFISTGKSAVFSVKAGTGSFSGGATAMARVKTPDKRWKKMPGLFRFQFRLKKITGNRELEFIYEIPEWEFYTVQQKSFNRPQKNLFSISFWDFYPVLSGLSVNITGNGEFKIEDNYGSAVKRITGYFPGKVSKAYITSCIDMELNRYILAAVDLEGGWKTLYSKNIIFSDLVFEGRIEKKLRKAVFCVKLEAGTGLEKNLDKNIFKWNIHTNLTFDCKY